LIVWLAISVLLISFFVALLCIGWLAHSHVARLALDEPNARSLHSIPVPRTGGIGLLIGIAAGWALIAPQLPWFFWAALALLIAISLIDDLRGLSAALRMIIHLCAALLLVRALPELQESLVLSVVAIFLIGWMCNLYNFMDGSDGLAGGMAVSGFLVYAVAAWLSGSMQFALLNLAVAAAAAGFLVHNFHPARIFLGDAGAVPLGFLASTFGIIGWLQHDWAWWFPILVFSPFIVDASVTLARRLLSGARVWEAHRDHYYQRLVQMGLGHRGTALAEYGLMVTCGIVALWTASLENRLQLAVLIAVGVLYAGLILVIQRHWRKRQHIHA